jgi:uridine phosphorylase
VANRVLTVGDPARAERIAAALDEVCLRKVSARGFVTYTGRLDGVDVSIVAIGMGFPMADFFVRETRQIISGPMLIARYGTCGILQRSIAPGVVIVATEGSVLVQSNPDFFARTALTSPSDQQQPRQQMEPYLIFRPQPADHELSEALVRELQAALGDDKVARGLNASADSFYSSQGRIDAWFADENAGLLERLRQEHPSVASMEMETFQILALAARAKKEDGGIRAAAASIGVANRPTGQVCSEASLDDLEVRGGKAALRALIRTAL